VRTTIDIPDDLLRQAKARAAIRGMKLKDYVAEALRMTLYYPFPDQKPGRVAEDEGEQMVLDEDCIFPLIRGRAGPKMKGITGETIGQILEDEDVACERDTR
jgi:hypothetical protein